MAGPWDDYQSTDGVGEGVPAQPPLSSAPQPDEPADDENAPSQEQGPWNDHPAQQAAPDQAQGPWNDHAAQEQGPWNDPDNQPELESSGGGAIARGAVRGAITTFASLPEIGIGAGIGQALIPIPVVGAGIGALGGAIAGGYMANDALNTVLESLGLRAGTGFFSEAQEQADQNQHPYLSEVGNIAGGFTSFGTQVAKQSMRAGTAAIFGGLEAGQELLRGGLDPDKGGFDPTKIAIAAAGGYAMGGPRAFAERMIARGGAMIPGRPDVKATEQSIKDKEDAATSSDVGADNAPGTATEQPEPSVDVQPTENAPVRSDRLYPKKDGKTGLVRSTFGDISEELLAVMKKHPLPGMEEPALEELPLENATNREALQTPAQPAAEPKAATPSVPGQGDYPGGQRNPAYGPEPEPLFKNLPRPEAQGAQDIKGAYDDARARIQEKTRGLDEPLTPEQEAVPERRAAPTKPPGDENQGSFPFDAKAEAPAAEDKTLPAGAKPAAYEVAGEGDAYPHSSPELRGIQIQRNKPAPNLVGSNEHATQVMIDPRVPRLIDVNGKPLDPAQSLAIREIARRRILEELGKPVKGKEPQPFATRLEQARDGGLHAEHRWLIEQGYDPAKYHEIMDGIKNGGRPAPAAKAPEPRAPVTATVKYPKFVNRVLSALRTAGHNDAAAGLETKINGMPKADQIAEAGAAAKLVNAKNPDNLTIAQLSKPLATPRLGKSGYPIGDTGKTAKVPGEAARKSAALNAADQAFKANPAVKGETDEALVARAKKIVADAKTANNGVDPLLVYKKPTNPPPGYMALKEAQRLATGEVTAKKLAQFRGNEALGFTALAKETGKIEGGIAKNRLAGDEVIAGAEASKAQDNFPGETPHEEAEKDTVAEPVRAEDITPSAKEQTLDIKDMEKGDQADILADMAKVSDNLVNAPDDLTGQPKTAKWELDSQERAAKMAEQKAAREARAKEAAALAKKTAGTAPKETVDTGKSVKATPEELARYGAAADAKALAAKREKDLPADVRKDLDDIAERTGAPKEVHVEPKDGVVDQSEVAPLDDDILARITKSAGDLAKDENGSVNPAKIFTKWDQMWKTKEGDMLRKWQEFVGHFSGEKAMKGETKLRQGAAGLARAQNFWTRLLDEHWTRWTKNANADEQLKYQLVLEKNDATDRPAFKQALLDAGIPKAKAEWMADSAKFHRGVMELIWKAEKDFGSQADYVKNYLSHMFKDEKGARDFIQQKINSVGTAGHDQERSFEYIKQAMDAGYELKYLNPIDIMGARVRASLKQQYLMNSLNDLKTMGLANRREDILGHQKSWTHKFVGPDRKQWVVDPSIETLWKNAVESVGLRDRDNKVGSFYRAAMNVKNTFIPIKLGISAFHWVHVVLNVNLATNFARELTNAQSLTKDGGTVRTDAAGNARVVKDIQQTLGSASFGQKATYFAKSIPGAAKLTMHDAFFSLPDGFTKYLGATGSHLGKEGRLSWNNMDKSQAPMDQLAGDLIERGGGIGDRNEQDIIQNRKMMDEAFQQKSIKTLPLKVQNIVKQASAWMFEEQIPNLKIAAYLRDASALFNRRPDLLNNDVQMNQALSAIMKSNDNRYGEMFYNGVFMNKIMKDASIGSMLSLGWNLGQVREFGGALSNVVTGKGRGAANPTQQTVYDATNKGAYTIAYTATSMLSAAAVSYAMSGQFPNDWKDYIFPRVGGRDAEGNDRRLQTPFNVREPFMMKAHMDAEGPIGGLATFLWNKMVLSPVLEAFQNKDFYGRELYDSNAPWYQKAYQLVDSIMGDNLTPITASSMQRAKEQGGGGLKENLLAFAGMGPAPAYVNRDPLQRKLSEMYFKHGIPSNRPYQDRGPIHALVNYATGTPPSVGDERSTGRAMFNKAAIALYAAKEKGDTAGITQATKDMGAAKAYLLQKGKQGATSVGQMQPGDADKKMFARVPIEDKQALVRDMNPEQFRKLVMTNRPISGKDRQVLIKQWGSQNVKKSVLPSR